MKFFIGIDQTGAVSPRGIPRGLPLAFLDAREGSPQLRTRALDGRPLLLPTFSREALETVLVENAVESAHKVVRSPETALLVDAVFGLPLDMDAPPPRELFELAARGEAYGLKPAANFFDEIFKRSFPGKPTPNELARSSKESRIDSFMKFPVRACERLAKANSVFRTHPFQKNVQCGTYRIWRDLGLHGSDWLHLRYFERKRPTTPILYEAYPSAIWREVLGLRTRDRKKLVESLRQHAYVKIAKDDLQLMIEDADHADAGVLALGGFILQRELKIKRSKDKRLSSEGWIVGLGFPETKS